MFEKKKKKKKKKKHTQHNKCNYIYIKKDLKYNCVSEIGETRK